MERKERGTGSSKHRSDGKIHKYSSDEQSISGDRYGKKDDHVSTVEYIRSLLDRSNFHEQFPTQRDGRGCNGGKRNGGGSAIGGRKIARAARTEAMRAVQLEKLCRKCEVAVLRKSPFLKQVDTGGTS